MISYRFIVKELIYCLVLLLLTAVLYRIYHGFLTAGKGTVEFRHAKDCTGNGLLLLNLPYVTRLHLEGVFSPLHELFQVYGRTVTETHLGLPLSHLPV